MNKDTPALQALYQIASGDTALYARINDWVEEYVLEHYVGPLDAGPGAIYLKLQQLIYEE